MTTGNPVQLKRHPVFTDRVANCVQDTQQADGVNVASRWLRIVDDAEFPNLSIVRITE
jgi:hypothetical protein